MIPANELRIGNYVFVKGQLVPDGYRRITNGSEIDLYGKYGEPIPLTPELLEKCGFETDGKGRFLNKEGNELYFANGVASWEIDGGSIVKNIQALHQLQNLYFALTGQELNIQL